MTSIGIAKRTPNACANLSTRIHAYSQMIISNKKRTVTNFWRNFDFEAYLDPLFIDILDLKFEYSHSFRLKNLTPHPKASSHPMFLIDDTRYNNVLREVFIHPLEVT